jgi:hypothetical protein
VWNQPTKNGIYLCNCPVYGVRFERLFRNGIKYLDNKYIDLKNHPELDLALKHSLTNNHIDLTAEEQASAQNWLGVPTTYDELKDKPFYDNRISLSRDNASAFGVSVEIDGMDASGLGSAYHKAIMVSEDTYTADELIGANLTYFRIWEDLNTTIDTSHIEENTDDALWISIHNSSY